MTNNTTLQEVDELLTRLEDFIHGEDGKRITEMRGKIAKALSAKPAPAVEQAAKLTKKWKDLLEDSRNSLAYLHPGNRLSLNDWHKVYDNAIFLFIESLTAKEGVENCGADHLSIDELLQEFKRRGFDTSNWDGDEGAEKAIVDGVCNHIEERFQNTDFGSLKKALKNLLQKYHHVYAMADLPWEDYRTNVVKDAEKALSTPTPVPVEQRRPGAEILIETPQEALSLIIGAYLGYTWENAASLEDCARDMYEYAKAGYELAKKKSAVPVKQQLKIADPTTYAKMEDDTYIPKEFRSAPVEQQGDTRKALAQILRDNITFSPQTGDFIIHGAIEKIIEYFGQQWETEVDWEQVFQDAQIMHLDEFIRYYTPPPIK